MEQLTVYYKGKPALRLNERLLESQGVSEEGLENIKALHVHRLDIEAAMRRARSSKRLKELFATWTGLQFDLQAAWGFPLDVNYHKFWRVPKCICPKLDGDDRLGTPYAVRTVGCPIHGD